MCKFESPLLESFDITLKLYISGTVVAKRDSGWYSCAAVSESGSSLSRAEVRVAKETDLPPPIIQLGPVNQTLPTKVSATLPCEASDHDAIIWLKDGVPIATLAVDTRIYVDNDNTLTIKGMVFQVKYNIFNI